MIIFKYVIMNFYLNEFFFFSFSSLKIKILFLAVKNIIRFRCINHNKFWRVKNIHMDDWMKWNKHFTIFHIQKLFITKSTYCTLCTLQQSTEQVYIHTKNRPIRNIGHIQGFQNQNSIFNKLFDESIMFKRFLNRIIIYKNLKLVEVLNSRIKSEEFHYRHI